MSSSPFNRRQFLSAAGLAASTLALRPSVSAAGAGGGPATPIRIRKEVNTLSATEIAEYRNAVKILKNRSEATPNDPKGWRRQAMIHQNSCAHNNWFFLPWHRAYLHYVEAMCRDALGAGSTFTLPYWDWTLNPLLPAAFWGPGNPLNDLSREIDPNEPIGPDVAGSNIINNIVGITDFETFAGGKTLVQRPVANPFGFPGQIESGPHNTIHGMVGGNMGTYMSPLDPIFWLHHANIDRLWTEWARLHPAATTNDTAWLDFDVNSFLDTNGQPAKMKVSSLLNTFDLGYRYDTQPAAVPLAVASSGPASVPDGFTASAPSLGFASTVSPLSERLTISAPLRTRVTEVARAADRAKTIRLLIKDVPEPANQKFMVRVFLNCVNPNPRTSTGDPTFVGSFSFFGHEHDAAPAAAPEGAHANMAAAGAKKSTSTFCFDISEVIRRLERAGEYKAEGELKVSLVPVPLRRGQAVIGEIKPGAIEIVGLK